MIEQKINQELTSEIILERFKHLKFDRINNEHVVTLVDSSNHEILKGYGDSIMDAINDLHSNLL